VGRVFQGKDMLAAAFQIAPLVREAAAVLAQQVEM